MNTREQIADTKLRGYLEAARGTQAHEGQGKGSATSMQTLACNTFNRPVGSRVPVLGVFVVLAKKIIRRMVSWYANPFAQQQTEFNLAASEEAAKLEVQMKNLQEDNERLHQQLAQLNARVACLEQTAERGKPE